MKEKNVIIVHGSNSTERESKLGPPENERHWKPWLKRELELRGYEVSNELYPRDWNPNYKSWKKVFEKNEINEETVLVGHSAGTAFILRYLNENKKKVNRVVLVAPSVIRGGKYLHLSKLKDFEFDSSLKKYFNELIIFYAENDDEDIINSSKKVHKTLGGKLIELKNRGHYVFNDMGTKEFPELLEEILRG